MSDSFILRRFCPTVAGGGSWLGCGLAVRRWSGLPRDQCSVSATSRMITVVFSGTAAPTDILGGAVKTVRSTT